MTFVHPNSLTASVLQHTGAVLFLPLSSAEQVEVYIPRPARLLQDKERTMATETIAPDDEAAILKVEIPDELLESTARGDEMCAFTLGSCTGLSQCPA